MSQKVFVSYHKDNNLAVKKLHDDLQKRGIKTWLDAKDIKPGQPKRESLFKGIINSDFFIACLSPSFLQDALCRTQIYLARAHNLKILPVLIEKFLSADSPLKEIVDAGHKFKYAIRGIEDLHTLDFSGNYPIWGRGSYEKNFEELANVIQPIRKPSPLNSEPVYISYYWRTDREFSERLTRDLELARAST